MVLSYEWYSYQGTVTKNNCDYCGISIRSDSTLYVVVDGATRGQSGGELARDLVGSLVDQFLAFDKTPDMVQICDQLRLSHEKLRYDYPAASASYLIILDTHDGKLLTAHAGDCRLGKLNKDKSIEWLTKAHTLANAIASLTEEDLTVHPNRHQLTRSFRPRGFIEPEYDDFILLKGDVLLVATRWLLG